MTVWLDPVTVSHLGETPARLPHAEIQIGGKSYRKFIQYPELVKDGTSRCITCGQIDEFPYHNDADCPATGGTAIASIIDYIIPRLGPAQRKVLISLTGEWGAAACARTARRMFYGVTDRDFTLVQHKHCTDNCWRLTDLGIAVRDAIARVEV